MFRVALCTVVKNLRQLKISIHCGFMGKIKWGISITTKYFEIKKNEVFLHATEWMNLENIVLSERN